MEEKTNQIDQSFAASRDNIDACQFQQWYEIFRSKTIKSRMLPMPSRFLEYLKEDGLVLPEISDHYFGRDDLSDDEELVEVTNENEDVNNPQQAKNIENDEELIEFMGQIQRLIKELKGEVFIKTNWSAPIDAGWMNATGMKVTTKEDVFVLLKSSDRTVFDLEEMYELCNEDVNHTATNCTSSGGHEQMNFIQKSPKVPMLVLRKWANLHKSMEFRVFVREREIVGICQRDCSTFYDFLADHVDEYHDLIVAFHDSEIRGSTTTDSYAVDIYIDKKKKLWIIDFNAFGEPTCSLLFEWSEIWDVPKEQDPTHTPQRHQDITETESPVELSNVTVEVKPLEKSSPTSLSESLSPFQLASISHSADDADGTLAVLKQQQQHIYTMHKEMLKREHECAFRFIEKQEDVLQSNAGTKRGPVDVHLAPDFQNFMEICKAQQLNEADT